MKTDTFIVSNSLFTVPAKVWNMESLPKPETLYSLLSAELLKI